MHRSCRLHLILLLAFVASGCAIVGGSPPERHGGTATLGGAATAASDTSGKVRNLDVGDRAPTYPDWSGASGVEVTSVESGPPPRSAPSPSAPEHWFVSAAAGGGSLGGAEFKGFGFGSAGFGRYISPRARFDLTLMGLSPNLTESSVAGQGLKDEFEIAGELSFRYYLTPPHTFLSAFPLAGMRMGTLFWSYENPVQVIADGETKLLEDDYLNYFGLFAGLGVALVQTRHFSTGMHLTGGFRTYEETTFEGFHNNLFPTTGYTQLAFELNFRF